MAEMPDKRNLCFVVGPIGAAGSPERTHADWLLKGIVQPVFSERFKHFDVVRADKISAPGMIDSQVITMLIDADLVIADMSFLNANAFYEMGIRHMIQKPIIHMFREGDTIPFDVAPYRAIKFSHHHPDDLEVARTMLTAAVDEVLKPDFQVENPVTRARGAVAIREHATPEMKLIMDELAALRSRTEMLHNFVNQRTSRIPIYKSGNLTIIRVNNRTGGGPVIEEHLKAVSSLAGFILDVQPQVFDNTKSGAALWVPKSIGPDTLSHFHAAATADFPDLTFEII